MKSNPDKPIVLTLHARRRMGLRGATQREVWETIRRGVRTPAKRGKWHSTLRFEGKTASPFTGASYNYKTVDVVFADELDQVVVLTVKTYFHNE